MIYFYYFLQSNLLEWPVYLNARTKEKPLWLKGIAMRAGFITLMNSITHPMVFFVWMTLPSTYLINVLIAESFAIFVEAFILKKFWNFRFRKALGLSAFANFMSWQIAPMLTYSFFQNNSLL